MYPLLYSACGGSDLGFYCAIQIIRYPQTFYVWKLHRSRHFYVYSHEASIHLKLHGSIHFYVYSHEALNGCFHILMACEKAGTASLLGYPVTLLFTV